MIQFSNWEIPAIFGDNIAGVEKMVASFNVELENGAIKAMNLWKKDDIFDVRCSAEHKVEMSTDTKETIRQMAVAKYKAQSVKA